MSSPPPSPSPPRGSDVPQHARHTNPPHNSHSHCTAANARTQTAVKKHATQIYAHPPCWHSRRAVSAAEEHEEQEQAAEGLQNAGGGQSTSVTVPHLGPVVFSVGLRIGLSASSVHAECGWWAGHKCDCASPWSGGVQRRAEDRVECIECSSTHHCGGGGCTGVWGRGGERVRKKRALNSRTRWRRGTERTHGRAGLSSAYARAGERMTDRMRPAKDRKQSICRVMPGQ
jgi:hypothetical protein